jgi:hypothetical protein
MKTRNRLGDGGYAAMESLVAMGVGLLIAAGVASFNHFQLGTLLNQSKQVDMQSTTRGALDIFANEVRRAGMDPTRTGTVTALDIVSREGAYGLRLQSDLNGNGEIDGGNEDVIYVVYNGNLIRIAGGTPSRLISDGSLTMQLEFYDGEGNLVGTMWADSAPPNDLSTVRRVGVTFDVQEETQAAMVGTDVNVRNRFFLRLTGTTDVDEDFLDTFDIASILNNLGNATTCLRGNSLCQSSIQCCSGICSAVGQNLRCT